MNLNRDNIKKIMGLITFAILLYVGLQNTELFARLFRAIVGLIMPFLIGGCLAFVINVPMRFIENRLLVQKKFTGSKKGKKIRRTLSLVLTIVLVIGVISIVLFMVVPELYQSVTTIGAQMTLARSQVPILLENLATQFPMFRDSIESFKDNFLDIDWKEISEVIVSFFKNTNFLSDTLNWATSVASGVTNAIIGIVFAIYILFQKENLGRQFRRLFYAFLPEKYVDYFLDVCKLTSASFNSFLSGQCLEAIILGLMFFVSMSLFNMPYALVIAVLIGVTALIPIFGAFIGCFVGIFLILIINPIKALWFVILFLVLQQVEGNVIYPRVVGGSVGLPSIWVLAAVTLGASLAGVLGILFSIPLMSVIYTLLRQTVRARIAERQISQTKID